MTTQRTADTRAARIEFTQQRLRETVELIEKLRAASGPDSPGLDMSIESLCRVRGQLESELLGLLGKTPAHTRKAVRVG